MELFENYIRKSVCIILISNIMSLGIFTNVQASLITSEDLLNTQILTPAINEEIRNKNNITLQRDSILHELIAMGVAPELELLA